MMIVTTYPTVVEGYDLYNDNELFVITTFNKNNFELKMKTFITTESWPIITKAIEKALVRMETGEPQV